MMQQNIIVLRSVMLICLARTLCTQAMTKPHIAVVGGGLAGLTATIEASRHGAHVTLIEKEAKLGGNSAKATSGINGVGTRAQREAGVTDSIDSFIEDTMKAGRGLCNRELVEVLANESSAAIEFIESFHVKLDVLSQLGGHSFKRTHREANRPDGRPRPIGWDIVSALKSHVEQLAEAGMVTTVLDTKLANIAKQDARYTLALETKIQSSDGDVAASNTEQLEVDAVILTTGGYSASVNMLAQYAPGLENLPTTNGPWAKGEGIALGQQLQAAPEHLEHVQVHPTGFVDPNNYEAKTLFLAPEALRGSGGILLSTKGERFVNELAPRDVVTGHIWRYSHDGTGVVDDSVPVHKQAPTNAWAYLVLDSKAAQTFGKSAFGFYHKAKKFFTEVSGTQGLADHIAQANAKRRCSRKPSEFAIRESLEHYAQAARGIRDDAYGKSVFPVTDYQQAVSHRDHPLFVAMIQPVLHYTMGGLRIDTSGSMLNGEGEPISGLYGAGEVTAGVHGANRLGGNSLLECVVFGRVAGKQATLYSQALRHLESHDEL